MLTECNSDLNWAANVVPMLVELLTRSPTCVSRGHQHHLPISQTVDEVPHRMPTEGYNEINQAAETVGYTIEANQP